MTGGPGDFLGRLQNSERRWIGNMCAGPDGTEFAGSATTRQCRGGADPVGADLVRQDHVRDGLEDGKAATVSGPEYRNIWADMMPGDPDRVLAVPSAARRCTI